MPDGAARMRVWRTKTPQRQPAGVSLARCSSGGLTWGTWQDEVEMGRLIGDMTNYFVRYGFGGYVGRFAAVDATAYPRGVRVICRTERGLEAGEVLGTDERPLEQHDGQLLRPLAVEDELLLDRLNRHRERAFEACQSLLAERQIPAMLLDVEHLFDGESLYFYFLGDPPPGLEQLTHELAELYEQKVEFRRFADSLHEGCGPGCGTEEAENGCQSGGCQSCVIATACRKH